MSDPTNFYDRIEVVVRCSKTGKVYVAMIHAVAREKMIRDRGAEAIRMWDRGEFWKLDFEHPCEVGFLVEGKFQTREQMKNRGLPDEGTDLLLEQI